MQNSGQNTLWPVIAAFHDIRTTDRKKEPALAL